MLTFVEPRPGVDAQMRLQDVIPGKCLIADFAFVGFFPGVGAQVLFQVT